MIKMSTFLSIKALSEEGVPKKEIARRLGIDVRTVRKHVRSIGAGATEPRKEDTKPRKLDRFRAVIEAKITDGLSAMQIFQDLRAERGFDSSYQTVRRLVAEIRPHEPEVYKRLRFEPGEEAQIDFGEIVRLQIDGTLRRVYLFVMTLCYSRMAYYEIVTDQKVPTFLGAIRRGFEHFGGAPRSLKLDNLRSGVLWDGLGQRYYQEDFYRLCRHYGTVPDAARVATPTDKGRCERDIGYAKSSCFRGRVFSTIAEYSAHLERWREEIANVRIHGTTRRAPVELFEQEKLELKPLPDEPYEISIWGRYLVRKDCHVHVLGNYYSVPYRLVGSKVLVSAAEKVVTTFAEGEVVARHERALGKGETITDESHYPATKRHSSHEVHRKRLLVVRSAGPHAAQFLGELKDSGWVFGPQLAQLAELVREHGADALDQACRRALFFRASDGARVIERILERDLHTLPLPEEDTGGARSAPGRDYGRPLGEYEALLCGEEVEDE